MDITNTMTIGDVARAMGLSVARIRQLDAELEPIKAPNGHRRYDPQLVERVIQSRAR